MTTRMSIDGSMPSDQDWERVAAIVMATGMSEDEARYWLTRRTMRWWKLARRTAEVLREDDEQLHARCYAEVLDDAFERWMTERGRVKVAARASDLVKKYRIPFFRRADYIDEAAQEAYERIYRQLATFDPQKGPFNHYAELVASSAVKNFYERDCGGIRGDQATPLAMPDEHDAVDERAHSTEVLGQVSAMRAELSPTDVWVLEKRADGYSHEEIAVAAGMSEQDCCNWLRRAKRSARKRLRGWLGDGPSSQGDTPFDVG